MAWRSSSVKVLERTGRKGAGEPARDVRNCDGLVSLLTGERNLAKGSIQS